MSIRERARTGAGLWRYKTLPRPPAPQSGPTCHSSGRRPETGLRGLCGFPKRRAGPTPPGKAAGLAGRGVPATPGPGSARRRPPLRAQTQHRRHSERHGSRETGCPRPRRAAGATKSAARSARLLWARLTMNAGPRGARPAGPSRTAGPPALLLLRVTRTRRRRDGAADAGAGRGGAAGRSIEPAQTRSSLARLSP